MIEPMVMGDGRARYLRWFRPWWLAVLLAAAAGCGGRSVRTLEDTDAGEERDAPGATSCEGLCEDLGSCAVSADECLEICAAASALASASGCERPYADLVSCFRTLDDFCPTEDTGCTAAANAFNVCTFDYCLENRRECRYD